MFRISILVFSLFVFILSSCDKLHCLPAQEESTDDNTDGEEKTTTKWTPVNSPVTSHLLCTRFVDDYVGFIVGHNGVILKTTDGGQHWQTQTSGITSTLASVYMLDHDTGFACGDNGVYLYTTDGGVSWEQHTQPGNPNLKEVYFIDHEIGFMGGTSGTLLKTIDGGQTWTNIEVDMETGCHIYSIHFLDNQTGYLAGSCSYIAMTTDGGNTWTQQPTDILGGAPANLLVDIEFADVNTGYAVGSQINSGVVRDSYILKTSDGGKHWNRILYKYLNCHFTAVEAITPEKVYVVGGEVATNKYYVLETTNGLDWSIADSSSNRLTDIWMRDADNGLCVGLYGIILEGHYYTP